MITLDEMGYSCNRCGNSIMNCHCKDFFKEQIQDIQDMQAQGKVNPHVRARLELYKKMYEEINGNSNRL